MSRSAVWGKRSGHAFRVSDVGALPIVRFRSVRGITCPSALPRIDLARRRTVVKPLRLVLVVAFAASSALSAAALQEPKTAARSIIGTVERLDLAAFDELVPRTRTLGEDRRRLHLDRGGRLVQARQMRSLLRHPEQRRHEMARRQRRVGIPQTFGIHRREAARRQARRRTRLQWPVRRRSGPAQSLRAWRSPRHAHREGWHEDRPGRQVHGQAAQASPNDLAIHPNGDVYFTDPSLRTRQGGEEGRSTSTASSASPPRTVRCRWSPAA